MPLPEASSRMRRVARQIDQVITSKEAVALMVAGILLAAAGSAYSYVEDIAGPPPPDSATEKEKNEYIKAYWNAFGEIFLSKATQLVFWALTAVSNVKFASRVLLIFPNRVNAFLTILRDHSASNDELQTSIMSDEAKQAAASKWSAFYSWKPGFYTMNAITMDLMIPIMLHAIKIAGDNTTGLKEGYQIVQTTNAIFELISKENYNSLLWIQLVRLIDLVERIYHCGFGSDESSRGYYAVSTEDLIADLAERGKMPPELQFAVGEPGSERRVLRHLQNAVANQDLPSVHAEARFEMYEGDGATSANGRFSSPADTSRRPGTMPGPPTTGVQNTGGGVERPVPLGTAGRPIPSKNKGGNDDRMSRSAPSDSAHPINVGGGFAEEALRERLKRQGVSGSDGGYTLAGLMGQHAPDDSVVAKELAETLLRDVGVEKRDEVIKYLNEMFSATTKAGAHRGAGEGFRYPNIKKGYPQLNTVSAVVGAWQTSQAANLQRLRGHDLKFCIDESAIGGENEFGIVVDVSSSAAAKYDSAPAKHAAKGGLA